MCGGGFNIFDPLGVTKNKKTRAFTDPLGVAQTKPSDLLDPTKDLGFRAVKAVAEGEAPGLPNTGAFGALVNPVGHSIYAPVEEKAAIAGGALGFLAGGPIGAVQGATAAYGAVKAGQAIEATKDAADEQKAAVKRAETQQARLLEEQATKTAQQKSRADKRVADRQRSAALANRKKTRTGSRTGVSGIQDTILRLGKSKLGGG